MKTRIPRLTAFATAALGLSAASVHAQTTYQFTDASGGTQAWSDGTNWNGGVAPNPVAGDTIQTNLTQSAATFLDLEADRTFANWSANFQGFNSRTFTINSGHTNTLAGSAPTITVSSGNVTFNNVLAGTDGLIKAGNDTLSLTNAGNTFSGGIQLSAGTLQASSNGAFGAAGNDITVTGNSTLSLSAGTYARNISINNAATLSFSDKNTVDISGAVTGAGGFAIGTTGFGSQSLTLSSTSNTFTGNLRIGGGDSGTTVTVNSLADSTTGTLEIVSGQKGPGQTFVWGSGATSALVLNDRQVVLSGTRSQAASILNSNTNVANTISINKDLSVTRTVAGTFELGGVNTGANTVAGVISDGGGATSLLKSGSGTWILGGDNTYTGATDVTGGTLIINGITSSTSIVSVSSGATLGGSGTVGGATTINGNLSPGTSPGTLTFSNSLTLNDGATYNFEAGDLTAVSTTLTLNNNWTLALGSGLQDGGSVLVFTYGSLAGGSDLDPTFNIDNLGFTPTGALTLSDNGSGSIFLNGVSAIPEPSAALLGALGFLALLRRRR